MKALSLLSAVMAVQTEEYAIQGLAEATGLSDTHAAWAMWSRAPGTLSGLLAIGDQKEHATPMALQSMTQLFGLNGSCIPLVTGLGALKLHFHFDPSSPRARSRSN